MPKNDQTNSDIIEFVRKTTEAITVISQSTKQLSENTGALKEMINAQNVANVRSFEAIEGKMDGLATMFKYVIIPLVGGVLALVGVKTIFNIP